MKKLKYALPIIAIVIMLFVQSANANWYAGNRRIWSAHGFRANIATSSSTPSTVNGLVASWVSTPAGNFTQSGWVYYHGWSSAHSYIESYVNGNYFRQYYGSHSWNTSKNYAVDNLLGSTNWCGSINYVTYHCVDVGYSFQNTLQALSEIQGSSANVMDAKFSSVQYRNSSGNWYLNNQSWWLENSPYKVNKTSASLYTTYGP
ncbi:MAG TPA: hypothetical protein EYH05_08425 [Anaerolineae bacterium]|nr:hypothetical protein [Anaerolineae bacterium]